MACVVGHYSHPYGPTDGIVAFLSRKSSLPVHCSLSGAPCQERCVENHTELKSSAQKLHKEQKEQKIANSYEPPIR